MRDETKCPQGVAKAEHALHCKCDHYLCWSDMRIQAELARLGPTSEFAARLKAHEALGEKVSCNDPRPGISHDWSCDDVTEVIHGALTRDAEHRAELDAAQATIEQLGKDAAALAAENERLRGELAEAKRLIESCPFTTMRLCDESIQWTMATTHFLAAPPPAESTPVQREAIGVLPRGTVAGHQVTQLEPAPPDDIRARLERHGQANAEWEWKIERRLAALEAKGEPGTHAFVELTAPPGPPRECRVCGNPDGQPWHPKGAKP